MTDAERLARVEAATARIERWAAEMRAARREVPAGAYKRCAVELRRALR